MKKENLTRFLNGTASPDEKRQVLKWFDQEDGREIFDRHLKEIWKDSSPSDADMTDYESLLQRIHKKVQPGSGSGKVKRMIPWIKFFRIAASLLLLIACAYFLKKGLEYQNPVAEVVEKTITKATQNGEKLTLVLPDGTKITLNSNSSLSFSSSFGQYERVVRLSGEAYFIIAKDSLRPFRLITDEMVTTALGTEFNAYARLDQYAVALTEGRVAIDAANQRLELIPGQRATVNERLYPKSVKVDPFDFDKTIGWKEGQLVIDRKPLKVLLEDLSSWYGVEMKIDPQLNLTRRVIGTFRNKNLTDVLTGLGFSMGFDFEINGKVVFIKKESL
ncbi:FecR family protein [Cyclobacterium jeungdonense]|uniref:FecR domain-containing protein n=1 Tax=Cyclobacterium jeungdonense TaxID=708087 RepID=A0ABT8CGG7_9BACT|nr:FecR domain-containing protein [Cyclobacterium jeungdonense]MDN3690721.1 FecR domain-containing protein [Cyclobacterium jeungdonense]